MDNNILQNGGVIESHRTGISPLAYKLITSNCEIAQLKLESNFGKSHAFYVTPDATLELKSDFKLLKPEKYVMRNGIEIGRLEVGLSGRKGFIITNWAHRYCFNLSWGHKPKTTIIREVGNQEIFNIVSSFRRNRTITINQTNTEIDELHALLSLSLFHLILLDRSQ